MRIKAMVIAGTAAILAASGCGRSAGTPPPQPEAEPEEVAVGYDTRPSDDVTGAISSVSGREIADAQPMRIQELLRGRVAGLEIVELGGGNVAFRIRGTAALRPGHEQYALVVVDGVMIPAYSMQSALAGLIPEDIRQIDVLKDVASTSIYGMRGAGGVIVITTTRK